LPSKINNHSRKIAIVGFLGSDYVLNLASLMRGHSADISFILSDNLNMPSEIANSFKIYKFQNTSAKNPAKLFKSFRDLLRILYRERFNTVHFASPRPFWTFIILFFLKRIIGSRILITLHEPFRRQGDPSTLPLYAGFERFWEIKLADVLILGGESIIREFQARARTWAKVIACGLGVDCYLTEIHAPVSQFRKNYVLFFGRIQKYKGLDVLIQSFKDVNNKFSLVIAGKGEIIKTTILQQLLAEHRVKIYNSFIDDVTLCKLISHAKVVAAPYLTSTQSGVIGYALAYNTPVITTRVGTMEEVVKDGITGFVIEPNNSQELTEKLNFLLNNEELQIQIQQNIEKEKILVNNKIAKKLESIYFLSPL
jgi:glycosyltransferase involved in cell wall biosynthesis